MNVVLVGGGVIGLSIAWRLGSRGADVSVIDPSPGHGTSWVAGGMLAPIAETSAGEEHILRLGLRSAQRYPSFVAALSEASGRDPGYTRSGTLVVARDPDDAAELEALQRLQAQYGVSAERLSSSEARRLEPALAPGIRGALWLADDHQIDNRALIGALLAAVGRSGIALVPELATAITARSVTTDAGRTVEADAVVVACGATVPPIDLDGRRVVLPIRPVKGQILRLQSVSSAVLPTRTVRGRDVYVIPRAGGELAVGATSEERGHDLSVTAGAVGDLLRDARELLPGLAESTFVEAIAGLRPATPDNAPILGRLGPDGPYVAAGHYRHGILLAPVTADVMADLVLDGDAAGIEPFAPDRFLGAVFA